MSRAPVGLTSEIGQKRYLLNTGSRVRMPAQLDQNLHRSVLVPVVQVGHMGMLVRQRGMRMAVTMSASRHGVMSVVVMTVFMCMSMLVLQGLMSMLVFVRLNQVQNHTGQHQHAS
jgi:hypothetical protein